MPDPFTLWQPSLKTLGFGQPDDAVIQLAYVVADLAAAIDEWRSLLRVGPWFTLRGFAGLEPLYRGRPAPARCDVAFGFAGHVQIELIQQMDGHSSQFRRADGNLILGFHHFGVAAPDFAASEAKLDRQNFPKIFTAVVASGGRVAVYDTTTKLPGMIELIETDAALDTMFTAMHRASVGWDGSDPVRDVASLA